MLVRSKCKLCPIFINIFSIKILHINITYLHIKNFWNFLFFFFEICYFFIVITGFVGFTGLVHRMTVDRCLPQVLLIQNDCRKTRHYIIGFYWLLTSLLVLYTWGNVEVLAGVYTVAFLSVMFSFTVGNMLLKLRRYVKCKLCPIFIWYFLNKILHINIAYLLIKKFCHFCSFFFKFLIFFLDQLCLHLYM